MKVLANDGIEQQIVGELEQLGFEVIQIRVAHEQIAKYTRDNQIDILLVQKGTIFSKPLIDDLKHLKAIVFANTWINMQTVDQIKANNIEVIWPENSTSNATAELVIAHLLSGCRLLQEANRTMPLEGDSGFKFLQESYQNGIELKGKTLGIVGMNAAGIAVAQKAIALGMNVVYCDEQVHSIDKQVVLGNKMSFGLSLKAVSFEHVLLQSHFLTIHTREFVRYVIDKEEMDKAENLIGIINCSYSEAVNEVALVDKINEDQILFAALDRFEEEPIPAIQVLMQPAFSLSPNINGSTRESQILLWEEIIDKMRIMKNKS